MLLRGAELLRVGRAGVTRAPGEGARAPLTWSGFCESAEPIGYCKFEPTCGCDEPTCGYCEPTCGCYCEAPTSGYYGELAELAWRAPGEPFGEPYDEAFSDKPFSDEHFSNDSVSLEHAPNYRPNEPLRLFSQPDGDTKTHLNASEEKNIEKNEKKTEKNIKKKPTNPTKP